MGSADRIERERQAKRARILDAARELFLERGIAAVTLREVAQRIEYSTTAIYVQFKDKQELVEQMVREDFSRFSAALLAKEEIADPVERLVALGDAYVEFALAMPRHYQLLFMTARGAAGESRREHLGRAGAPGECGPPGAATPPPGADGYLLLLSTIEECVRTGRFRPELTDPPALAQAFWAAVHGLVSLLIVMGGEAAFEWRPPHVLTELTAGSLLRGLLAGPPPPRPAAAPASAAPARPRAKAAAAKGSTARAPGDAGAAPRPRARRRGA